MKPYGRAWEWLMAFGAFLALLFGMLHLLAPPASLWAQGEPGVQVRRDIPYARGLGADPHALSLDIHWRARRAPQPVMVYVHGGGWQTGDKARVHAKPTFFVGRGFAFVSVNYRLTPAVDFPVHAEDVARAVAWVVAHAADFGIDPARVYLMGHSAGAHLAALVATDARYLNAQGLELRALSGVVPLDTQAYDLPFLAERGGGLSPVYRATFGDEPDGWRAASPIAHVAPGKGIPPMAVAYSGGNGPRPNPARAEAAARFVAALRQAGVPATRVPAPEKTHAAINREFGLPGDPVSEAVVAFFAALEADE